ncbi:MAG: DUF2281 domain-containing protein [Ignavibacteria bacterium]|nr:DUF2281 domain-containing protein [Ignavibacteria bacterium]
MNAIREIKIVKNGKVEINLSNEYNGQKVEVIVLSNSDIEYKKDKTFEVTMMSESSLSKDWLKPEEDEAWKNL